ncbi:cystinosin [Anaeramoeba flamelloides]|uniref:Cystinosin n=1 Tax=Anaeramoeba flamelloides TaxID=1746091 RepID=A0ABQ8XHK8_9EUKA|nr:cystinosin [Anaeramoeba flamelloides]
MNKGVETLSLIIGYIYMVAWSLSFYPQNIEFWQRKRCDGYAYEYAIFNLLAQSSYLIYNCLFFWSSTLQQEYSAVHSNSPPPVHSNDVIYSMHAVTLVLFTIYQLLIYERGDQKVKKYSFIISIFGWISIPVVSIVTWKTQRFDLLDLTYWLAGINNLLIFFKYLPQVWLNYKKKKTVGFSIEAIILDLTGGLLSLLQLFMDAINKDDYSTFKGGNLAKFGLSLITLFYDTIFLIQHFVLYKERTHDRVVTLWGLITGQTDFKGNPRKKKSKAGEKLQINTERDDEEKPLIQD